MLKYTNFYITENDIKLMRKILKSFEKNDKLTNYDKQCFFRLIKDMNDAIMELGGNTWQEKIIGVTKISTVGRQKNLQK